jgi:hypothetical protein
MIYHQDSLFPSVYGPSEPAEPSQASIVRPSEEHVSSSQTDYEDLFNKAEEALRLKVANKTSRLYTEQGPDSSKAFLSALCTLPAESFDRLWAGVLDTSIPFNSNTSHITDAGSTPTGLRSRGTIGTTGDKAQIWVAKLDRFVANIVGALTQLV